MNQLKLEKLLIPILPGQSIFRMQFTVCNSVFHYELHSRAVYNLFLQLQSCANFIRCSILQHLIRCSILSSTKSQLFGTFRLSLVTSIFPSFHGKSREVAFGLDCRVLSNSSDNPVSYWAVYFQTHYSAILELKVFVIITS